MSVDITTIPLDELVRDLQDSEKDIHDCTAALLLVITTYSGGSVQERLDKNRGFVRVITAEIKRRAEESKNCITDPAHATAPMEATTI